MRGIIKLYDNLIIDSKKFFSLLSLNYIFSLSIYQVFFRIIFIIFFPYLIILYWLLIIYKYIVKYFFLILDILVLDILIYFIDISKYYFILKYYLNLILTDILFVHVPRRLKYYWNSISIKNLEIIVVKFIILSGRKIYRWYRYTERFIESKLYYGRQNYYKIWGKYYRYKRKIRWYYFRYRFLKIIFTINGLYFIKNIIYYFFPLLFKHIWFNSIYYIFIVSTLPKEIYIYLGKKYIYFYMHFLIHLINAYRLRYFTIITIQNIIFFLIYLFWWIIFLTIIFYIILYSYTYLYNIILILYKGL